MKAVILNGSRGTSDGCDALADRVAAFVAECGGSSERYDLRKFKVAHCVGCFQCWVKTPGVCRSRDRSHDVARALLRADVTVLVSPVTFGGFSSQVKKILDRTMCLLSPFFRRVDGETHHGRRYDRYPALLAVGELASQSPAAAEVFRTLVARNAINMHAPASSSVLVHAKEASETVDAALAGTFSALAGELAHLAEEAA